MPSPARKAATSGGSGAAPLRTEVASPRPSRLRIGPSTRSWAAWNWAASSGDVICPCWQLST